MKTIDRLEFTELTDTDSVETNGGLLVAPLIPVLGLLCAGIGICVAVFMHGYTVGKALF